MMGWTGKRRKSNDMRLELIRHTEILSAMGHGGPWRSYLSLLARMHLRFMASSTHQGRLHVISEVAPCFIEPTVNG